MGIQGETNVAQLIREDSVHGSLYTNDKLFELEMEKIFYGGWVFVGHDSEVPAIGDYQRRTLGREEVLMIRQRDHSVAVVSNRCAHRGNLMRIEDSGRAKYLTCTYHGWVYDLSGALVDVPYSESPRVSWRLFGYIHFECTIRNDKGHALPPNSRGEVWLRSSTLMQCYLNLPEETAQTLHEGWLRTNDIGYLDDEGYLYLLDRQKFMIISGGVNVFPTAVEAVLAEHACVQEVAVIGVPHPEWGEAVVAVVVTKPAQEATIAELIDFCREKLSSFDRPKYIVFVETLPKTPNAKVKKTEIKKWLSTTKGLVPWDTVIET